MSGMDSTITAAATVAAIASAVFVFIQVREMQRQTNLQREIREAAEQPYVWADVGIAQPNGWDLELIIGNSGPTVATNVRVVLDPPIQPSPAGEPDTAAIVEQGAGRIASLAPGRRLFWPLGPSHELVNRDGSLAHTVTIDCDGPFGPVATTQYVIDLRDQREAEAKREGSMHEIRVAIDELTKKFDAPR